MAEIIKPDMTALWASGGAVVAPTNNKINEGWTAEIPPHQWENFVQLRQDEAIAYLYQRGIAEWDNTTEYFANKSVVLYNSILYIATVNNQNTVPTNTSRWRPLTGNANTSIAGLMSPEDKLKLDGIEAGAQVNTILSVAGKTGDVTLSVGDVSGATSTSTRIIAGTGLTGGGDLSTNRTLNVSYGTTSSTAAQGNDSRITGAMQKGANLSDVANAAIARNNLGLGSASTRNVGTGSGNVLEVGAFGLGAGNDLRSVPWVSGTPSDYYGKGFVTGFVEVSQLNPTPDVGGNLYGTLEISFPYGDSSGASSYFRRLACGGQIYTSYAVDGNTWSPWVVAITTGNILQTTGQFTQYPMSQKAVTDELNKKANTSTQIISGTGLTGGGNLSANRTLSVNYGTTGGTAAQGNDSRITGAAQRSANLSDLASSATARSNLGLGTAATATITAGPLDSTVGRVLKVGDHGIGSTTQSVSYNAIGNSGGFYSYDGGGDQTAAPYSSYINVGYHGEGYGFQILMKNMGGTTVGNDLLVRRQGAGTWGSVQVIYHSGNTTIDPNGFIKGASPIIRLYSDRIEDEGEFHQKPQLERVSKGVYKITGTLGLRMGDGWYLETPSDRNGNKYFNIEWEQDVEPENEGGVVDTPVEVVLTVRTYERVWNPQTGIHEDGNPVDINEHQDRYVSLRFNELRQDDPVDTLGEDDVD